MGQPRHLGPQLRDTEESVSLEERLGRLEGRVEELSKRVDDLRSDMNNRLSELRNDINRRLAELSKRIEGMSMRMDDLRSDLSRRIDGLRSDIRRLGEDSRSRFRWLMGTIIGFIGALVEAVITLVIMVLTALL